MAITTTKQFNVKIGSIKKSASTLRENVQECFDYGLNQYAEHGNSTFLSILQQTVYGSRSMASAQLLNYTQAHANVTLTDAKDKKGNPKMGPDGKALKVFKKREGEAATVTKPTVKWYEFEKEKVETPIEVLKKLNTCKTSLVNAKAKGKLATGQAKKCDQAIKALSELIEKLS